MQRYDPTKEDGGMSDKKPSNLRINDAKHYNEAKEGHESDKKVKITCRIILPKHMR
jgi:hypothetical protein